MADVKLILEGRELAFSDRLLCVAGRAHDCGLRIDGDTRVSRHHCLLDINPPFARVRDFGSLNGTRLNGVKIGQRDPGLSPQEGRTRGDFAEHDLCDGDELRIGGTVLRVELPATPPPPAASAGKPEAQLPSIGGYEVLRELNRGGMGAVYLARAGGETVALKVMLPEVAARTRGTASFLREIENTRALGHPNIVAFRDSGAADGTLFLAMEFCARGSLMDRLAASGGTLPVEEAVAIGLQALDGLAYAHDARVPRVELADGNAVEGRGVVHRDVKPPNILIDAGGVAKVADFGLSKALDRAGLTRHTRTGMVGGTPAFMAREQLVDYRYAGPRVDVWSLAACLYWMLTGTVPRDFLPGIDRMLTVLESDAVPIRHRRADIPPAVAEVVDHALTETPRIGFPTAAEFAQALRQTI